MSEQPIKLTDEPNHMHWLSDAAISDIRDGMVEGGVWEHRADAFCAVVRALRDRARAVVDDVQAKHWMHTGSDDDCVVEWEKVRALNEVLP